MVPTRVLLSVLLALGLCCLPAYAGSTSHAMELDEDGAVLFVDLEKGRLLRFHEGQLSVMSGLEGMPADDAKENLIRSIDGDLYLGQKKAVWKVISGGEVETAKPPSELKSLFVNRPGDLAPDGSVYVARDFKNIQRSLPGGDAHPVLITDVISKIHSIAVTPYGRVFFANNTEIAKLDAQGEVKILQKFDAERILGLAAVGENVVLVLRQKDAEPARLERLDTSGSIELLVSGDQIAAVSREEPVQVRESTP